MLLDVQAQQQPGAVEQDVAFIGSAAGADGEPPLARTIVDRFAVDVDQGKVSTN